MATHQFGVYSEMIVSRSTMSAVFSKVKEERLTALEQNLRNTDV